MRKCYWVLRETSYKLNPAVQDRIEGTHDQAVFPGWFNIIKSLV
jgi:hypothetical protein